MGIIKFLDDYWGRLKLFNRNIRLMLISQFISGIGISFYYVFFNLYVEKANPTHEANPDTFVGYVLALANIATVIFALPAGYLAGRYSQKWILIIAQIAAIALFVSALSTLAIYPFLSLIFLAFAAEAFLRVVYGPFIMENSSPAERTYIFSIIQIIMITGGVFGNVLGGFANDFIGGLDIIKQAGLGDANYILVLGYRYTIISGMLLGAIGVIPLFFISRPKVIQILENVKRKIKLSEFTQWDWRFFLKAAVPATLVAIGAGLIVQFVNLYFKNIFDSPGRSIGIYMGLQSVALAAGILVAPVLAEKFGKVNTIVTTELISLPFMIVLALTGNIYLAVAAFILRSAFMNMGSPVSSALVLELCRKEEQGILNAILNITWSFSWAVSALMFGYLPQASNFKLSFFIAVVLYFVSSILFYLFFRGSDTPAAPEPAADSPANTPG